MEYVNPGGRVLIVDDEPMVREVLERYLTRSGFLADTAGDGEAAIAAFDATTPDLVLLDLMLPKLDGFSVFQSIRARASTPVIMLTARGDERSESQAWSSARTTTSPNRSRRAKSSPGFRRFCGGRSERLPVLSGSCSAIWRWTATAAR